MRIINKILLPFATLTLSISAHSHDYNNGYTPEYGWDTNHPELIEYARDNKDSIMRISNVVFKNGNQYLPYIYEVANEFGVPREVAVVAAIESAFNPNAISHAGATGMWQFMKETGRDMGLSDNDRKDWRKSTRAAIAYIQWLSEKFNGNYELAIIAYNGGIGKVSRNIQRLESDDPWFLLKFGDFKQETKDYLPKFISYMHYYYDTKGERID